ncbi:MAG: HU family DNA-binding protein [Thermodesulfovibrionales bacterium]
MTKSGLIDKVSENINELTRKQTEIIVETVFESMKEALSRGEKVEIRGFGNFRLKKRKSRTARNPKTGETVEVPAKSILYFKVGKELREAINRN